MYQVVAVVGAEGRFFHHSRLLCGTRGRVAHGHFIPESRRGCVGVGSGKRKPAVPRHGGPRSSSWRGGYPSPQAAAAAAAASAAVCLRNILVWLRYEGGSAKKMNNRQTRRDFVVRVLLVDNDGHSASGRTSATMPGVPHASQGSGTTRSGGGGGGRLSWPNRCRPREGVARRKPLK